MVTYTWGTNTCGIENLFNNQQPMNFTSFLFLVKDTKLLKNKTFLRYNRASLGHNILHIIISSPQKKNKNIMKSRKLSRISFFVWFVLIFFQGHFCTNGVWAFDHKGPKIARCPFTATHYFRKRKFYLTIKVWLKQEKKSLFSLEKMLNDFFWISFRKKVSKGL